MTGFFCHYSVLENDKINSLNILKTESVMEMLFGIIIFLSGAIISWGIALLINKNKNIPKEKIDELNEKYNALNLSLSVEKEKGRNMTEQSMQLKEEIETYKTKGELSQNEIQHLEKERSILQVNLETSQQNAKMLQEDIVQLKSELKTETNILNEANKKMAELNANNLAFHEKLETQKAEMESLRKQFNNEFELIANRILEDKSQKFTKLNHENLATLLKPLGENIDHFKKKVEEVYDKESKERFSLGKEVTKLVELNQKISEEATNLTNALKGNSKTQGDWGQMILENILENSGLTKDREYFVQEFLRDEDGNCLKNEEGIRMQPDVIIAYPDNRKVIVDSKVSLTAYTRFTVTEEIEEQQRFVNEHLKSIKKHIDELSQKHYQDFAPTLDFVMMFVPNEPAYLLALKNDMSLWQYAYQKRILLISPTNLIAVLKLIADLWKRDYQNKNAMEIATRGASLYDKFVGFVENLADIGNHLEKTQKSYQAAMGQLKEGKGNLISQVEKLKELGVKPKKNIQSGLIQDALTDSDEQELKYLSE